MSLARHSLISGSGRTLASSLAAAMSVVLFGCSEPVADERAPSSPSFNFTNGPATPGPIVVRIAGAEALLVDNDPQRNLMAVYTPTADNLFCGGAALDLFDVQLVFAASGGVNVLIKNRQAPAAVYATADFGELFDPDFPIHTDQFCAFINGPKKIAEGTVDFSRPQHFSELRLQLAWSAQGFVNAVSGGRLHLKDQQTAVLQGGDIVFVVGDILLQPVP